MPSYTATVTPTNIWSNINMQTQTGYTTTNPTSNAYSDTERTSVTPPSRLHRPDFPLVATCFCQKYRHIVEGTHAGCSSIW